MRVRACVYVVKQNEDTNLSPGTCQDTQERKSLHRLTGNQKEQSFNLASGLEEDHVQLTFRLPGWHWVTFDRRQPPPLFNTHQSKIDTVSLIKWGINVMVAVLSRTVLSYLATMVSSRKSLFEGGGE